MGFENTVHFMANMPSCFSHHQHLFNNDESARQYVWSGRVIKHTHLFRIRKALGILLLYICKSVLGIDIIVVKVFGLFEATFSNYESLRVLYTKR